VYIILVSSIDKCDGLNAQYFFLREYLEQYTDQPIVEKKKNNDKNTYEHQEKCADD
jgi:hypothetical protein